MTVYKNRYLGDSVVGLSKSFPVLLLTGPRQVGKTTLLKHLSEQLEKKKYNYVSLDEFEVRNLAKKDPALFMQQYPTPLIIDEVQYAPELFPYIKSAVDKVGKNGMYWLTGSQQFNLMRNVSESLAGRVGILNLMGLSLGEEYNFSFFKKPWTPSIIAKDKDGLSLDVLTIFEKIVRGSYPKLFHRNAPPIDSFYGSYIQTYIDRDLRDLVKVSSLLNFQKFVQICAARTASMLNFSDLARDSNVSVNTAKEWLSLLISSGLVYLLKPFYNNISKRLIKAPKLYFLDTGLASYLTGWRDPVVALKGAFAGQLFETYVISEILKSYLNRGREPRFFYYRTKEKVEIDLLIESNGLFFPVEIKLAARVDIGDLKGIESLRKTGLNLGAGAVISATKNKYVLTRDVTVFPVTVIS